MPYTTELVKKDIKALKSVSSRPLIYKLTDPNTGENLFWDQELSWSIVEQVSASGGYSAYVNCTINPAWSRRHEHSLHGTLDKEIVQVFRRNQPILDNNRPINQSTLLSSIPVASPIAFTKSPTCLEFATPWCVLQMVQSMISAMDTDYLGIRFNELPRQTKSNPLSRLTTLLNPNIILLERTAGPASLNKTAAAMYEMEMKFALERMYKHILAGQFRQPEGIAVMSCTDCSVQSTYWVENKTLFMALISVVNGLAALSVLISIGLSIAYKSIKFNNIRMIEVVQLEAMG
ncbi:hypothetical protein HDU99_003614, partial [Rhizoclosmatium hyalinum]